MSVYVIPPSCVSIHSDSQFELSEQKSKVVFRNSKGFLIHQVDVDSCVFGNSKEIRCDWLVNVNGDKKSFLIELKGSDVAHAYEQLKNTHYNINVFLNKKVIWIISYSGRPAFDTSMQDLILKAFTQTRAKLFITPSPHECDL